MRIIRGKYRAKRILAPKNLPVRPTTDMAKEALFSILEHHFNLDEIRFLDLFSGTGNISYEMASRSDASITAVDSEKVCIDFIKKIAEELKFSHIEWVRSDALLYLQKAFKTWDIIFADPPYDYKYYEHIIEEIFDRKLLDKQGMLIMEHGAEQNFEIHPHFVFLRRYGSVHFSFFESERTEDI